MGDCIGALAFPPLYQTETGKKSGWEKSLIMTESDITLAVFPDSFVHPVRTQARVQAREIRLRVEIFTCIKFF
jgi:hypothetical protein